MIRNFCHKTFALSCIQIDLRVFFPENCPISLFGWILCGGSCVSTLLYKQLNEFVLFVVVAVQWNCAKCIVYRKMNNETGHLHSSNLWILFGCHLDLCWLRQFTMCCSNVLFHIRSIRVKICCFIFSLFCSVFVQNASFLVAQKTSIWLRSLNESTILFALNFNMLRSFTWFAVLTVRFQKKSTLE